MTDPADRLDGTLADWLDAEPRIAPANLLVDTMARTRRTSQRPAWAAIVLGAPTLEASRGVAGLSRAQLSLLALVALAAAAAATAIAAGVVRSDPRLAFAPSSSPNATVGLLPSPFPGPTTVSLVTPTVYTLVERPDLGFEVAWAASDGVSSPWDYFGLGPGTAGLTFGVGGCSDNICSRGYVAMTSGASVDGVTAYAASGPVLLTGGSLEELAAAWQSKIGPIRASSPVALGGIDGLRIEGSGFGAILAVHDGRLFVLQAHPNIVDQLDRSILDIFVPRFRVLDPPFAINGRQTFNVGVAAGLDPNWTVVSDNSLGLFVGVNGRIDAGSNTLWTSWVRTLQATTQSLADVERELLAEPTPEAWIATTTVGGKPAHLIIRPDRDPVAIVDDGSTVETISAHVDPTVPAGSGSHRWADAESLLRAFLASVAFDVPVTTSWRDLRITLPPRWSISGTDGSNLTISPPPRPGQSALLLAAFRISALAPGDTLEIQRPTASGTRTFAISGQTLDELGAGVESGLGAPRSDRAIVTLGGQPAYRWIVTDTTSFVGPFTEIMAVERNGTFYLVTARVAFVEAVGFIQTLLDGISFP